MLLEVTGDTIFKTSMLSNALNSAKFRNTHLKLLCDLIWGEKRLRDAKTKIMIPAFLLDNNATEKRTCEPRIFHNLGEAPETGIDDLAADVVMRTIAAPTYFPSYQQVRLLYFPFLFDLK
jgi:patatin-like phospholipase/acyl hydrolase